MKNKVLIKTKNFLKTWSKIFLLSCLAVSSLAACGKKGGGSEPAPVVYGPGIGPNGVYGAGNLLSQAAFQASYWQGAVNLSGAGNFDPNDPYIIHQYVGPVALSGTLQVMNQSLCGAPVGAYNLTGQGQIQRGIVYQTTLTAAGPANLQILINQATAYNPTTTMASNIQGNRFGIQSATLVVNNQPCGQVTGF